jgi:phytoene synthase
MYLEDMVAGQKQDLVRDNYQHFEDLYRYCYLVASSVGLICITIWGYEEKNNVRKIAEQCGIAFQLTNILRDLVEDVRLNRVYLPAEFVNKEKLTTKNFFMLSSKQLMVGIHKLINKTDEYYRLSYKLYKYIHRDGQLTFLIFVHYYHALFEKIQANPQMILANKYIRLNKLQKFFIIIKVIIKYYLLTNKTPE